MLFFSSLSLTRYGHRLLFNEELIARIPPVYFRLPASIVVCTPQTNFNIGLIARTAQFFANTAIDYNFEKQHLQ